MKLPQCAFVFDVGRIGRLARACRREQRPTPAQTGKAVASLLRVASLTPAAADSP